MEADNCEALIKELRIRNVLTQNQAVKPLNFRQKNSLRTLLFQGYYSHII